MKKTVLAMLAGAALAATPAFAQFEGEIAMKITMRDGCRDGQGLCLEGRLPLEIDLQTREDADEDDDAHEGREPRRHVHDQRPAEVLRGDRPQEDEGAGREDAGQGEGALDRQEARARETVNGYSCEHVLLTRAEDAKSEQEIWTSKDISGLNYESMRGLMRRGEPERRGDDEGAPRRRRRRVRRQDDHAREGQSRRRLDDGAHEGREEVGPRVALRDPGRLHEAGGDDGRGGRHGASRAAGARCARRWRT